MDNKKIGLFIATLRKDKNMTQKDLAGKLFVSDKAVSKWERGLAMPDIGLIEKLAECLDADVSEILRGEKLGSVSTKTSDETGKDNIPFFQKKYFKNIKSKIIFTGTALILLLAIILYIFGTIDYIRATKDKKPIFTYRTVDVSHEDVNIKGTDYYGIGYKVSLCNNETGNYIFQLGHEQKRLCYSSLTCCEDERGLLTLTDDGDVVYVENDKHTYKFSFFEDILYFINITALIPTSLIENEEIWTAELLEYFDVPGIDTTITKINETTYEMKQTCSIPEILKVGARNVCSVDYFGTQIFGLTKNDIVGNYRKDACK